jgi:hypothetical protein
MIFVLIESFMGGVLLTCAAHALYLGLPGPTAAFLSAIGILCVTAAGLNAVRVRKR